MINGMVLLGYGASGNVDKAWQSLVMKFPVELSEELMVSAGVSYR